MWASDRRRLFRGALVVSAIAPPIVLLSGCAVATVAAATAGAVISVAGTVVVTTVKVTGKVIEKTVDAVTPDAKPAAP